MLSEKCNQVLSVDIGATYTRLAIFDNSINIIKAEKHPTCQTDLLRNLRDLITALQKDFGTPTLSISVAGPVYKDSATLCNVNNNPTIAASDFLDKFERVYIINDASAAVIAESYYNKSQDLAYITISSGIGGGIMQKGRLASFIDTKSEIGHMIIPADLSLPDMPCGCGSNNHWESYCSGKNIGSFYKNWLNAKQNDANKQIEYTPKEIFTSASCNNKEAKEFIINEIGKINTFALNKVIELYEPQTIVLGGSVALNNKDLIMAGLDPSKIDGVKIRFTDFGDDICLIGAAIYAKNNL